MRAVIRLNFTLSKVLNMCLALNTRTKQECLIGGIVLSAVVFAKGNTHFKDTPQPCTFATICHGPTCT